MADEIPMPPSNDSGPDCHACSEYNALSRRQFLGWTGATAAAAAIAPAWMPRVAFARDFSTRDVIVSIYLRGGADGLTLCVPYAEPAYYTARPTIYVPPPGAASGCTDLNGFFGLPPAMAVLHPLYQAGHMAIVHATGSTDSTRSHFDAQRYMEVGKPADPSIFTGWLGRHIASVTPADPTAPVRAIGVAYQLQQTLVGAPKGVPVPDLANYVLRGASGTRAARTAWLDSIYDQTVDPILAASNNTMATINTLAAVGAGTYTPLGTFPYPPTSGTGASSFSKAMKQTAALIAADVGVEAVAIDKSGWDTHSAQGVLTGTMAGHMADLANTLRAFYEDVVIARNKNVTIVIMSEFGRRVQENGSQGLDHGHGNCMFLIGKKIAGGQVVTQWPGLSSLYQNLDLDITIDFRDILAEICSKRLENANLAQVFPGYTPTFRNVALL